MADSKKYNGSTWEHSLRKLTTATDTLTTLPADIYADGTNATVGIKGNMSQTGTPSPDNPIQPQETGERTDNEWNVTILSNSSISAENYWEKYDSSTVSTTMYMSCEGNTTYYLYTPDSITSGIFRVYTSTRDTIPTLGNSIPVYEKTRSSSPVSLFKFTTGANDKLIVVQVTTANSQTMADNAVLDKGYKIPISSANTNTPVYLGEVESTRRIRKLVLTGEENFVKEPSGSQQYCYYYTISENARAAIENVKCTHLNYFSTGYPTGNNKGCCIKPLAGTLRALFLNFGSETMNAQPSGNTDAGLKEYLAAQYANGTPVIVWYVLATETTGIVNEPIRKIGNYADTVSGITIPTIAGKDTVDVQTTLKPSEVSLSYTGWHNTTVKEWDGSDWQ